MCWKWHVGLICLQAQDEGSGESRHYSSTSLDFIKDEMCKFQYAKYGMWLKLHRH